MASFQERMRWPRRNPGEPTKPERHLCSRLHGPAKPRNAAAPRVKRLTAPLASRVIGAGPGSPSNRRSRASRVPRRSRGFARARRDRSGAGARTRAVRRAHRPSRSDAPDRARATSLDLSRSNPTTRTSRACGKSASSDATVSGEGSTTPPSLGITTAACSNRASPASSAPPAPTRFSSPSPARHTTPPRNDSRFSHLGLRTCIGRCRSL